jgi:hypothetical protein
MHLVTTFYRTDSNRQKAGLVHVGYGSVIFVRSANEAVADLGELCISGIFYCVPIDWLCLEHCWNESMNVVG